MLKNGLYILSLLIIPSFEGMHRLAIPFLLLSTIFADLSAAPLTQKSVDLTHAFDENTISFPVTQNPDNYTLKSAFYYPYGVR